MRIELDDVVGDVPSGGGCPSLAPYVTGTGATSGGPLPERVNVGYSLQPLDDLRGEKISGPRMAVLATGIMAVLGVVLSTIGCFAVFSAIVVASSREIALRMALGATSRNLLAQILVRAIVLSAAGIAGGLLISAFASGYVSDQFYRTNQSDAMTLIAVALGVIVIAAIARYIPARRAAAIDPSSALKVM